MARRFFLPIFLFFDHFVTVQSVIYRLKGQQVQFDPDITGQPEEILWRHNDKIIVKSNRIGEEVFGSFEGRLTLNQHSAQLQISDLRLEDSGKYECDVYMDSNWFSQSYELEVIEKVAKPTITCQMNSDSTSTVSAVLVCSVELNQPQSSLKFEWSSKGNVRYGPRLTIFLGGELDEKEYTCQVSNPRSNETASFRAKDCHTGTGSSAGTIASIVLIPILIICLGLVILLWSRSHKRYLTKRRAQRELINSQTQTGKKAFEQILDITREVLPDPDIEQLREAAETSVGINLTEAGPAEESRGVMEDMVSIQESCSAPQDSGSVRERLTKDERALKLIFDITNKALNDSDRFSLNVQNEEKGLTVMNNPRLLLLCPGTPGHNKRFTERRERSEVSC